MDAPKTTDPRIRALLDRLANLRRGTLLAVQQAHVAIQSTEQMLRRARAELADRPTRRDRGGLSCG